MSIIAQKKTINRWWWIDWPCNTLREKVIYVVIWKWLMDGGLVCVVHRFSMKEKQLENLCEMPFLKVMMFIVIYCMSSSSEWNILQNRCNEVILRRKHNDISTYYDISKYGTRISSKKDKLLFRLYFNIKWAA